MNRLVVLAVLALALVGAYATINIESVVSRDTGVDQNRVVINLSGDARYSVQPYSGGTVYRVIVPDAGTISGKPDYKRLSPVIDRISTYKEGNNAVIEIRTMDAVNVNHSIQDGKIVLNLGKTAATPVVKQQEPAPKQANTPAEGTTPSIRYFNSPQEIATINVKAARKPVPKPILQDTLMADRNAAADNKQLFPATSDIDSVVPPQALDGDMPDKVRSGFDIGAFISKYRIWGLGLITLVLLFFVLRAALKKPAKQEDLKGTTLVLDDETKTRMVMKLLKEGWKATQIARELNLPLREVEHVISLAQMSGGLEDHH